MQQIKLKTFGIDVGESKIVVTKVKLEQQGEQLIERESETREFKYDNEGIQQLINFLGDYKEGIMEATGVYFYYLYDKLTQKGYNIGVVNPLQLREILGKKTDELDSKRLALAYAIGAIKTSYIPKENERELRELERHRKQLEERITQIKNMIRKTLQTAGYKIEPFNKEGRQILDKLVKGQELTNEEKEKLKNLLGRKLNKGEVLILKQLVEEMNMVEGQVKEIDDMIATLIPKATLAELLKIPGIGFTTASTILGEVGDISRFSNSKAFCSYAGLSPRTKQSGEFLSHNGLIPGNKYLRRVFFLAAVRVDGKFNEFYTRIKERSGSGKKALVAVANKLARIVFHVLRDGVYKGDSKKVVRVRKGREPSVDGDSTLSSALDKL
ncbi:IS110 family transposase [Sulfolobus tengchongensis]|uniref:IS110 family transposase n=1 Tax=Sulfolobus tengchongensis TaxID=207809 RepID=A0AAX4KWX5_9CREN